MYKTNAQNHRDAAHGNTIWNTAVVISHTGSIIGKHRKVT
jgi:beta-ureidopropionase